MSRDAVDTPETARNLRQLFEGGPSPDADRSTMLTALRAAHSELLSTWSNKTGRFPRLSLAFAEEAIVLLVLGALATVSIDTYRRLFALGDSEITVVEVLDALGSSLATGVDLFSNAVGAFPYGGILWELSFAYSLLFAEWLFYRPTVSAALLILLAVSIGWLERKVPAAVDVTVFDRRPLAVGLVVGGVTTWFAGVIPAVALGALGVSTVGGVVGLLAALVVFGWWMRLGYRALGVRLRELSDVLSGHPRSITAYVLLRRVAVAVGALLVPFVPIYALYVLGSGRLVGIAGAFADGSVGMQALVALGMVTVTVALAILARQSWGEFRAAIEEAVTRRAIKTALLARGFPVVTLIFVGMLAVSVGAPAPLAVAVGIAAGFVVRLAVGVAARLRRKASLFERPQITASRVIVHGYTFETADGEPRYYAEVNTTRLAHEDRDELVAAIQRTTRRLFDDGDPGPSVERQFAADLFGFGIVDLTESKKRLFEEARIITRRTFKRRQKRGERRVDAETLESRLERKVPEPIWRAYIRRRIANAELKRRDGYYAPR